jgi:hypothetical protein
MSKAAAQNIRSIQNASPAIQKEIQQEREAIRHIFNNAGAASAKLMLIPFILFNGLCAGVISAIQSTAESWSKGIRSLR